MNRRLMITGILFVCLTSGKLAAQHAFSEEVIEGRMPYTKGEVKQEVRFINSWGLKKYSEAELVACKKTAERVGSILADWLNDNSLQGFDAKIITFLDFLPDATFDSPLNDPHPKVYAKIELHFAPFWHTANGKYPNYAESAYVSIFLNGTDNYVTGAPVAGNFYLKPCKTAEFFGACIYQTTCEEITVVSHANTSVFQSVSQEEYLQTAIKEQQENKKNTGQPTRPPDKNERRKEIEQTYRELQKINKEISEEFKRTALKELDNEQNGEFLDLESKLQMELDQMPATERLKPAFYAIDGDVDLIGNYSGLCPGSHHDGCEALVRTNPELTGFSPAGKINLMILQWHKIQPSGANADKPRFYESEKKHDNVHQWNLAHLYQQREVWETIFNLANN